MPDLPDLGEFQDPRRWAQLCANLYKQWVLCRRQIPVSPDRNYAEEDAVAKLEREAQAFLLAAGISPYGL